MALQWAADNRFDRYACHCNAQIGATKASVLGVFEPITAILVGTLMFGEPLTTNIVVGIGIAIVAVTFMISVTKR